MVLTKDINTIINDFDFYDGIVSDIRWDPDSLFDLLVTVCCFCGEYKNKDLTIRFKNCKNASFSWPPMFRTIPKAEISVFSWYTITGWTFEVQDKSIEVKIETVVKNPNWLTVDCEEVWIEYIGE